MKYIITYYADYGTRTATVDSKEGLDALTSALIKNRLPIANIIKETKNGKRHKNNNNK